MPSRHTIILLLALLLVPALALAQDDGDGDEAAAEGEEEAADGEEAATEPAGSTLRRGNRVEFDARLIRGETAGSGAVFLFNRVPRPLPSMVERRTSYLAQTVAPVLGMSGVRELRAARQKAIDAAGNAIDAARIASEPQASLGRGLHRGAQPARAPSPRAGGSGAESTAEETHTFRDSLDSRESTVCARPVPPEVASLGERSRCRNVREGS